MSSTYSPPVDGTSAPPLPKNPARPTMPNPTQPKRLLAALCLALPMAAVLALAIGPLALSPSQLLDVLLGGGDALSTTTVIDIRAPRVLLALLVGAALACSGVVVQTLFRNPLAEPGLLGISSGAALAAVSCIVLFPALLALPLALPAVAFMGASLAALLVVQIARISPLAPSVGQLLAGIAINALAAAGIGVLSYLADDLALRSLTFWMFGSLGSSHWSALLPCTPLLALLLVLAPGQARRLDVLQLSEADAAYLGVDVPSLRRRLLLLVVISVGTAVALSGIIGFVGLVVPHLLRLAGMRAHRQLLPASALLGALLLLTADTVARTAFAPGELPVGMLTALLGAPFFIVLLLRRQPGARPSC